MDDVVRKIQGMGGFLVLGLLAATQALAADETAAAPLYQVELVVFRNGSGDAAPPAGQEVRGEEPVPESAEGTALAPPGLHLANVATRLQRATQYRLLLHAGWSAPVRGEREARPIALPPGAGAQGLRGHLTVYHGRFYHLALELDWRDPATGTVHHLSQARRMKNGVVNYFDHPAFGVIAVVREEAAVERTAAEAKEE